MKPNCESILIALFLVWSAEASAQGWSISRHQRITDTEGADFGSTLHYQSYLGCSLAGIGDLDGDGIPDLVAGARRASGKAAHAGSIYVLFLNRDGTARQTVRTAVGIGLPEHGYTQEIWFGAAIASLGDIDGDGLPDLAVGQTHGNDWGPQVRGVVWILFPDPDGTIRAHTRLTGRHPFPAHNSISGVGDVDGDGVPDLALGDPSADDGGLNRGALDLLFLNRDGAVRESVRISSEQGMEGKLEDGYLFGQSIASLGDLDGNGVPDLAVGSPIASSNGRERGCVWILFLNAEGTVERTARIGPGQGGFGGELADYDHFGCSVTNLGDLDGDGVQDLGVGLPYDDTGGIDRGGLWVLLMTREGSVREARKLTGIQDARTWYGFAAAPLGDLDNDGKIDLVVGAPLSVDDEGDGTGALWVLMTAEGLPPASVIDFDADGDVDFGDFLLFVGAFGSREGMTEFDPRFDLDANGTVDFQDFLAFAQRVTVHGNRFRMC